jgi:hypothetical protein
MRVFLASTAAEAATSSVHEMLGNAGHTVAGRTGTEADMCDCDAAVALVSSAIDPDRLLDLWEDVKAAQDAERPVIGATMTPPDELAAGIAQLPHEGTWVYLSETEPDPAELLAALASVSNGDVGDAVMENPATSKISRSLRLDRLKRLGRDGEPGLTPDGPHIFVSYSRKDEKAKSVIAVLKERGCDVWVDTSSIPGGADWKAAISQGIRDADIFVVLLSISVMKTSTYVRDEFNVAQREGKPIVPVFLRRTNSLPAGWDLALGGLHWVDLAPDFDAGIDELVETVGGVAISEGTFRARVRRGSARARRKARNLEIGSKAKRYGTTFAGGVAVAGAVLAKVAAERHAQQTKVSMDAYVKRTRELLEEGINEVHLIAGVSPQEYREEFRPKLMRILGQLEATTAPSPVFAARHASFVEKLEEVVGKFDEAVAKAERGDDDGYGRAITRLNQAWAQTMELAVEWWVQSLEASAALEAS